jgi:hypothetical protein
LKRLAGPRCQLRCAAIPVRESRYTIPERQATLHMDAKAEWRRQELCVGLGKRLLECTMRLGLVPALSWLRWPFPAPNPLSTSEAEFGRWVTAARGASGPLTFSSAPRAPLRPPKPPRASLTHSLLLFILERGPGADAGENRLYGLAAASAASSVASLDAGCGLLAYAGCGLCGVSKQAASRMSRLCRPRPRPRPKPPASRATYTHTRHSRHGSEPCHIHPHPTLKTLRHHCQGCQLCRGGCLQASAGRSAPA